MKTLVRRALPGLAVFALFTLAALAPCRAQDDRPALQIDPGGHTGVVHQVLFTPHGRALISVGEDKVIRVWDLTRRQPVQVAALRGQAGAGLRGKLYAAALSRDGKTLAVAGNTFRAAADGGDDTDHTYIWLFRFDDLAQDLRSLPLRPRMSLLSADGVAGQHSGTINALAFSPTDDNLLASAGGDRTTQKDAHGSDISVGVNTAPRVWDVRTGQCLSDPSKVKAEDLPKDTVTALAWSPDGAQVAAASQDGTLSVWDAHSLQRRRLSTFDQPLYAAAWSSTGVIAAGDFAGQIHLLDGASGKALTTLREDLTVDSLAFNPAGTVLAAGVAAAGPSYPVDLWSVPDGHQLGTFKAHTASVPAVAFSPDGATVASAGGRDNDIYLWDAGRPDAAPRRLAGRGGETDGVAWSHDTGLPQYLRWKADGSEHVFDFKSAMISGPPPGVQWDGSVTRVDGGRTVSADDAHLHVKIGGPKAVATVPSDDAANNPNGDNPTNRQTDYVLCETFTPDGRSVIVGSRFNLAVYDAASGRLLQTMAGHHSYVTSVAVSADGQFLASTSNDQTVAIWPLGGGQEQVRPLMQLFATPQGEYVAWNPDEGYYTASADGQKVIGWQTNNRMDELADYEDGTSYPTRNNPDVIKRLLQDRDGLKAAEAADASTAALTHTAPRVEVKEVKSEDGATVGDQVRVRVTVTPARGGGLRDLTVTVNGVPRPPHVDFAGGSTPGFTKQSGAWVGEMTLKVKPGANEIAATAVGADGTQSPPTDLVVTSSLPASAYKPALTLLTIGISEYLQFVDLAYPDVDAQAVASAFKKQGGPVFSAVHEIGGGPLVNAGATGAAIKAALAQLQSAPQSEDDYTVIYIAAHGGDLPGEGGHAHYYLLPYDLDSSTADAVKRTAVDWNDLSKVIAQLPCHVLLFLDTCHSGGKDRNDPERKMDAPNAGYNEALNELIDRADRHLAPVITFASCLPYQFSKEDTNFGHGVFTKVLLDGLAGEADRTGGGNHDGTVTIGELDDYLSHFVSRANPDQDPKITGSIYVADKPIASVGAAPAPVAQVPAPAAASRMAAR